MKISIGITTYNRKKYLEVSRNSLYFSKDINECNLYIYDDCSSEYNSSYLKCLFPDAMKITINSRNVGADTNSWMMYNDFLDSDDEILINADSDLIYHPDWIQIIKKYLQYTNGILTLYNSTLHPTQKEIFINEQKFCIKRDIGAAGTVFHRNIIEKIVTHVKNYKKTFDYNWSNYLYKEGIQILSTHQSYVQHIGIIGYNSDGFRTVDIGLNFYPGNMYNADSLAHFYHESLIGFKNYYENSYSYRAGRIVLSPLIYIKKLSKKLKKLLN